MTNAPQSLWPGPFLEYVLLIPCVFAAWWLLESMKALGIPDIGIWIK